MEAENVIQEGDVCVEFYRNSEMTMERAEQEREEIQQSAAEKAMQIRQENEKMAEEYRGLGLNGQVVLLNKEAKTLEKEAQARARLVPEKLGFQKISQTEMKVWEIFLPTEYGGSKISKYSFDLIPKSVLTEWEAARITGLFTDFSIRTPEGKSILKRLEERLHDPILVGWFEQQPYLISRWGESLKSFKEIKLRVLARKLFEPAAFSSVFGLWLVLGVCLMDFAYFTERWWASLNVGYWLCLTAFIGEISPALWREMHLYFKLDAPVSEKEPLQTGALLSISALSFLFGLAVWVISLVEGIPYVGTYWIISLIIFIGTIIWLVREIKKRNPLQL